ncbi:alanyl-tRNA synthetase [mine drainage metagenome]|uniref:Alanine--tRNA ligase n=1 Tax=mine drainage metagenome TaxID=410659 RepID=T1BDJ2_9ZZZZ
MHPGEAATVILERTPFYAESGGQVGDSGVLDNAGGHFAVEQTLKLGGSFHGHGGHWQGRAPLKLGDSVRAAVDAARRQAIVLNHSATHLLHAALRAVLGMHVQQKGSLVAPERLRFDYSHTAPLNAAQRAEIETRVNAAIRANHATEVRHMAYQQALDSGAIALFGEKYGDEVRVLRMGETSTELCGGTHVARTGDIGLFKIIAETGVAAGVRRIEALTGAAALAWVEQEQQRLDAVAQLLGSAQGEVTARIEALLERQRKLEREIDGLKAKAAGAAVEDLLAQAQTIAGIRVLAARIDGLDAKGLREALDRLKQSLGDCVVLLAATAEGKASLVAGVQGAAQARLQAGDLVAHVARQIGGKGGGRADMAQGGGNAGPELDRALSSVAAWVGAQLAPGT